nr:DUF2927 domain-containing protein [Aliiroseovarius subalbicans]
MNRRAVTSAVLAGATLLAACDLPAPAPPGTRPAPRPDIPHLEQSAESKAMATYYSGLQRGLLTQGLLRTDGGGVDVPFSARDLSRNFLRIAFYQEYTSRGGRLVAQQTASRLHRWRAPVRVSMQFGASVSDDIKVKDTTQVAKYTRRLARVTGHPITTVASQGAANFHVLVLNEDERRNLGSDLARLVPGISFADIDQVTNMPRETYCLVFATPQRDGHFNRAVAVIRAEHPDLLRTSCLHEEIAQGLGLSNDSPRARPSIFNDDEEFGFLTTHDELLLQMLYDPRLRPNMTEAEARPIVNQIAAELTGGSV